VFFVLVFVLVSLAESQTAEGAGGVLSGDTRVAYVCYCECGSE